MKKLLLTLILTLISTSAMAEWTIVDSNADGGFDVYIDHTTIHRVANMARAWELYDYKAEQNVNGFKLLSVKTQSEYDCGEEQRRYLAYRSYSGNMGDGKKVDSSSDPDIWAPIAPGSMGDKLWKIVCGKK